MRKFSFLTLLAALLIVGCTEVTIEQSNPLTEINSLPDLTASFADEGETRTFVEDSKYLRWHEADLITAFFGNTLNRQYKFKGKTGDNSGTFSLVPSGELGTGNDLSSIYAVYPYDENTTITDNGVISLTLPATQTYAENSFGKGANTMVAVTESVEDTFLSFKNACGYLKLKLYGDDVTIASIEVKGNNEEKIAGSATATMEFGGVPTIAMNDEATTSVTLDCGEGVSIGATADTAIEFWFVLPETTFEGGITITATNTDGAVFSKSTTNTVAITRNDIQPMVALKAEFATAKPANNEIWYTSSDASVVTPNNIGAFGANVVSNVYENGMGIITFDGEVTKIGDAAFYGYNTDCSKLTSVIIPDSVTAIGEDAFEDCTSLTSITIPDSVTEIGEWAFYGCICLSNITISNNIKTIGEGTFNHCKSLQSIVIPDSVTEIGNGAFDMCFGLTDITIGNSVEIIGDEAFSECTQVTQITIPDSVSIIGNKAFNCCYRLESITIGRGVTIIRSDAFAECNKLSSIHISDLVAWCNVKGGSNVPYNKLYLNNELVTDLVIPDGVEIMYVSFTGYNLLQSVTIPDSVTEFYDYHVFAECKNLKRVVIGAGMTDLSGWTFSDCTNLEEVYCKAVTPPSGSYFFNGCGSGYKIYVPSASINSYKAATGWSNYADYIVGYNF